MVLLFVTTLFGIVMFLAFVGTVLYIVHDDKVYLILIKKIIPQNQMRIIG